MGGLSSLKMEFSHVNQLLKADLYKRGTKYGIDMRDPGECLFVTPIRVQFQSVLSHFLTLSLALVLTGCIFKLHVVHFVLDIPLTEPLPSAVLYLNNLERDRDYHHWPRDLHELLRPSYPGMLKHLRRNINNVVLVLGEDGESTGVLLRLAAMLLDSSLDYTAMIVHTYPALHNTSVSIMSWCFHRPISA